jgi:hypothetical protein
MAVSAELWGTDRGAILLVPTMAFDKTDREMGTS